MTFKALARFVQETATLPVPVDTVLNWIRLNTDHKAIELHGVTRGHKGFRGGFRRKAVSTGRPYSTEFEILTQILYGTDLPDEWKRLVIVKEALHVFDGPPACVSTPAALQDLIPAIIDPAVGTAFPQPVLNDHLGQYRAMAILLPENSRAQLFDSVEKGSRTITEIASFVRLPEARVDLWLRLGGRLGKLLDY